MRIWLGLATLTLLVLVQDSFGQANRADRVWTVLAFDAKDDGRDPSLPDAAQLSYRYDKQEDLLWFRVSLYGKPNEETFGVNIVVDTGGEEASKMNWSGANKDFKFDKLVTAWVTRREGKYEGTIGVGDASGVKARNVNNLLQNNVKIQIDGDSIVLGIRRADITDKMKMSLIAAVGSKDTWNDDIPNTRPVALDLAAPRPTRGLRELDLSRNNFHFPSNYNTLADNRAPQVVKKGQGPVPMILIPGVYSPKDIFDGFMARNEARYTFYVITPPGLLGTPARELPAETVSYGDLTWTRRLEHDVVELIGREKLKQPVIVAHGFPGSLVADELATEHPDIVSGVIDVAVMPVQYFPSPKDPSYKKPAELAERVEYVNVSWAQKWFKYVTAETWESNNYSAEVFSNDASRGEQARQQVESAPLEVKIRYLTEFMAADHTPEFAKLKVPLLALVPGFNQKFFSNPANGFYKISFQDAWAPLSSNAYLRLVSIPDARALMLDDQPKLSDDAIAAFIDNLRR
jgi:pimeloyl-ACP methyl ester carboxylesterase